MYEEAACVLEEFLKKNPADREAWLYHLLAQIKLYGVGGSAEEIGRIEKFSELKETERWIVRQIFFVLYDHARKHGDRERARFCETSLERLYSGSSITGAAALAEIEGLIQEDRYAEVLSTLQSRRETEPSDIGLRLYYLYASVKVHSFAGHEREIEEIAREGNLSDKQKEILRQIFILGFEEARNENREDKARVYQRLARRLVLGQSLGDFRLSREKSAQVEEAGGGAEPVLESPEEPVAALSSESVLSRSGNGQTGRRVSVLLLAALVVMTAIGVVTYESREVSQPMPVLPSPRQSQPDAVGEDIALISAGEPLSVPDETEEKSPPVPQPKVKVAGPAKKSAAKETNVVPRGMQAPERPAEPQRERVKEIQGTVRIRSEVRLREEPRFGAPALATIESGSIAHVLDARGDWLEVRTESGAVTGYVRREFTLPTESRP
jgi:hypothetical protein